MSAAKEYALIEIMININASANEFKCGNLLQNLITSKQNRLPDTKARRITPGKLADEKTVLVDDSIIR